MHAYASYVRADFVQYPVQHAMRDAADIARAHAASRDRLAAAVRVNVRVPRINIGIQREWPPVNLRQFDLAGLEARLLIPSIVMPSQSRFEDL